MMPRDERVEGPRELTWDATGPVYGHFRSVALRSGLRPLVCVIDTVSINRLVLLKTTSVDCDIPQHLLPT